MKYKLPLLCLALALVLSGCKKDPEETPSPTPEPSRAPAVETSGPVGDGTASPTPSAPPAAELPFALSGDYGPLVPFPGEKDPRGGYLFGLVTLEGKVVAEPGFSLAYDLTCGEERVLVLSLPGRGETSEDDPVALCASDGSWCTGFDYRMGYIDVLEDSLVLWKGETRLVRLSARDGRELETYDLTPVVQLGAELDDVYMLFSEVIPGEGWVAFQGAVPKILQGPMGTAERWYLLNAATGEARNGPEGAVEIGAFQEGLAPVRVGEGDWGYIDTAGDWVIAPEYYSAIPFYDGVTAVAGAEGWRFIDRTGKTLWEPPLECARLDYIEDGYWMYSSWDPAKPGGIVDTADFSVPEGLGESSSYLGEGYFAWEDDRGSVLWKDGNSTRFPLSLGSLQYLFGGKIFFLQTNGSEVNGDWTAVDLETGARTPLGKMGWLGRYEDLVTGEPYLKGYRRDGNEGETLLDLSGRVLYQAEGEDPSQVKLVGGLVACTRLQEGRFTLSDGDEVVFSWEFEVSGGTQISLGSAQLWE